MGTIRNYRRRSEQRHRTRTATNSVRGQTFHRLFTRGTAALVATRIVQVCAGNYFRGYHQIMLRKLRLTSLLGSVFIVISLTTMTALEVTTGGAATIHTSIPTCIQGQLSVAMEEGGYLQPNIPQGYTFLVANDTNHECSMEGFPWWIVFSHSDGSITKVKMLHRSNSLYAQPPIKRVILGVRGVASFGISYTYLRTPSFNTDPACQLSLIDLRLPATAAHEFSFEFPVHIDVCATNRDFDSTPVEASVIPLA